MNVTINQEVIMHCTAVERFFITRNGHKTLKGDKYETVKMDMEKARDIL